MELVPFRRALLTPRLSLQELAEALAQRGHLAYCAPGDVAAAFAALRPETLAPYPAGDAAPLAAAIDALCGVV